ncbi:MAG: MFS transporter [Alphaproteobacteria bacterium]
MNTDPKAEGRKAFAPIATAGIFFQGGAAAVDTGTIVAALVDSLTASPVAVGTAAAISRYGWLFPQLFVAHLAQRRRRRMPFYMFGAFGRALCLAVLAGVLWFADALGPKEIVIGFFVLWTAYAFISGIVGAPYNDIVARSIPSPRRSRLLAVRFFGGGILALMVAAIAHRVLDRLPFPEGYGVIFLVGAVLLAASAISFVSAGEPLAPADSVENTTAGFGRFLRAGIEVLGRDRRFRRFLAARWCNGAVAMALPFYIVLAARQGTLLPQDVAVLVAVQTAGALVSNPIWGWWGDHRGKLSLLRLVAIFAAVAPALALMWMEFGGVGRQQTLLWFALVFFLLGAVNNGSTIAQLGYLMEISPDERRPAYSGYFNALVAPVSLLPIFGGALAAVASSYAYVLAISLVAALLQLWVLRRMGTDAGEGTP